MMTIEEIFEEVATSERGTAGVTTGGNEHLRDLLRGKRREQKKAFDDALITGCWAHGFQLKLVKQEVSVYSQRPGLPAFYVDAWIRKGLVGVHFVNSDRRLVALRTKFEPVAIEQGYQTFTLETPSAVESFLREVASIEARLA